VASAAVLTFFAGLLSAQPPPKVTASAAHQIDVLRGVPIFVLDAGTPVATQLLGDGDAFIENDETWSLTIPLTNISGINATAINATLTSSTPGITIASWSSAYPDLPPAASGNNMAPYSFFVGKAVLCGSRIDFSLTVTYTGGSSPQTFNFSIKTGSPGAPVTFSFTGPPVPIPDSPGANLAGVTAISTLPVVSSANVYSLKASIDGTVCNTAVSSTTVGIDHTFDNDLQLDLKSPDGTLVTMINRIDGGGNNFCQVVLDDTAAISIQSAATAPFTGTWSPANPLSVFGGHAINGTWELHATDFFTGDTGNIRAWSVTITPAVCDAPPRPNVTGIMTAIGSFVPGGTVTYTVTLTNNGGAIQPDNPGDEFVDVFPAGVTLVSATASAGTAVANLVTNTVTWNGSIPSDDSRAIRTLSSIVTVTPPGCLAFRKQGAISFGVSNQGTIAFDADGNGTNETNSVTDDPYTEIPYDPTFFTGFCTAQANLTATKTDGVASATPGGATTYTITASNAGPSPANPATVIDTFPAACTSVSYTSTTAGGASGNTLVGTGNINDTALNLPAGGSVTYTANCTISPSATGTLVNIATVASSTPDPDPADNSATDTDTLAAAADLSLIKTLTTSGAIHVGDNVTYTLTVTNNGPSNATGVTVTDTLPAGLTYVSNSCGASFVDPTLTWNVGALAVSASTTCNLTATVNQAGTIVNVASATGNESDPTPSNNAATAAVTTAVALAEVPTLGSVGLATLFVLLTASAALALRRRRR